jgi:hypothetical protein
VVVVVVEVVVVVVVVVAVVVVVVVAAVVQVVAMVIVIIMIIDSNGSTAVLLDLGHFFSFLILYTVRRTLWRGDQPVTRPPYKQDNTNRITCTSMPSVEFKATTPVVERAKTVDA